MDKLLFYTEAKSIMVLPSDPLLPSHEPSQITSKVSPRGSNYHYRRDFNLENTDWVIFGVASTSDVDLVDDVIIAEDVFSDSLEEFVNTGRIFWEHGYKLAGKVEADNPITAPIGVPYLVEIHNNELLVYIVLDKSHPTAQMVWDRINQQDERFKKGIGLSIGALPQGKPVMMRDPITGNYVKKCPKMRLYEISVTGQPINPHTWTEVVKSFLAEEFKEEEEMAKATKDKKKVVTKNIDGAPEEELMGAGDPAAAADPGLEMGAPDAGLDMGAPEMASMGADPAADPMADPMADPALGGAPDAGGDVGGMLEMLGGPDEDSGLGDSAGAENTDIAQDVLLDKVDMLSAQMAEILSILNSESDAADVDEMVADGLSPDISDAPTLEDEPPAGDNFDTEEDEEDEEDKLDDIIKSLASQADRTDLIFEVIKSFPMMLKTLDSVVNRLDALDEREGITVKSTAAKTTTESLEDERSKYEAKTKSILDNGGTEEAAVTKGVTTTSHPGYTDETVASARHIDATPQTDDAVIKSILNNADQVNLLTDLVVNFKSISGTPVQVAERKNEVYALAQDTLGISRTGFRRAVTLVGNIED